MSARTATARLSRLAAHLGGRADRDLLREFVHDRSPAAFAELVRRHGPLVFGVCRRTLRHQQDSEDAFQATFLVLARRAARITTPEKLPGWLHSVAVRTATEIRRMRDRHQSVNPGRQAGGGSADAAEQHELAAAVDEVLAALPDHYRLPVVLCELRGLSRKQAAAELRVAEGTLSSRLAKARKLLAERLAKRGFAATTAAVSAALAGSATAKVPDTVAALAVGSWGGTISTSVSVVSDTVVKAMFASKLNGLVVSGGLMLALAGGLMLVPGGAGAQPGDTPTKSKSDPAEPLVQQLGSKEFAEREAAEKKLREMGASALPAVRAGVKSAVPEIAQRSDKLLAAIRKDDVDRFVKAFRADTAFKEKFDHPLWTRWAKVVGDTRGSRELFAELLGADGAAVTLSLLAEAPEKAKTVYPAELERIHILMKPRAPIDKERRLSWEMCYSMGEAAYVLYLGTFDGATSNRLEEHRRDHEADPEVNALEALFSMQHMDRGAWVHKTSRDEKLANRPLVPAVHALMAAQLTNLRNPEGINKAFRHDWGEGFTRGKLDVCLPLAKLVCRDETLPDRIRERKWPASQEVIVRSATWLYLAEAGETEFLPDIVKYQANTTRVVQFWRTNENNREYQVLVADVSIAAQLILHGQNPADYGFLSDKMQEKRKVYRKGDGYAFPDDESRKAAHAKALAFLKDAPKPEPKKDPEAERLVLQLGSKEFVEREAAEKKLKEMGGKALPSVRAGVKSAVPEIAERCERLVPGLRVDHMKASDHPVWKRFAEVAGNSKEAAALYADMVGDTRRAEVLEAVVEKPDTAGAVYKDELNRGIKALREGYDSAERRNRGLTGLNHPDSGVPTRGELALLLFLGTFPKSADVTPDVAVDWRDGLHASLFSYGLSPLNGDRRELSEPVRKLLAAWLGVRRDPAMIQHGFGLVKQHGVKEALPVARAVAADKSYATSERAAALLAVGMFGDATDVKLLEPLFDCTDDFHTTSYTYQGAEKVLLVTQVRDVAYGVALKLHGQEPADYGFEMCVEYKARGKQVYQQRFYLGFRSDAARTAAHDRVKAFLKTAPKPESKKDPESERLVQQLGSKDFAEREAAEKRLKEMGAVALPAIRSGLKSTSPEIIERCERVLAHLRTEVVRKQFAKLVGDDKPARELFELVRGSERGWQAIVWASEDPSRAGEAYRTRTAELVRVSRGLPPVDENGEPTNPSSPYIHGPPPVPFADVAAWLYLGTLTPGTGKWESVTHKAWGDRTSSHFEFIPEDDYTSAMQMAKEYTTGALAAPLKALTVKWLEKRRENDGLRAGLTLALRYDIPEVLPAVRTLLAMANDADVQPPNVAAAVAVVAEFGTKDDVPLLLPHLADDRIHVSIITELPKGITGNEGFSLANIPGVKKRVCQVRDSAAVAVLKLSGRDPTASGFPAWPARKHASGSPKSLSMITGIGFDTEDARTAAFEKEKVLFKRNPVPKAKPAAPPKKLDKMPDPSPELHKELRQFDENYRHGTPEKFAELEKKADELAKQFPETDDQARIWYEVAHVAAQSGINKQTERVRKYAPKCLEISRDPLHRAWMYSYLASTEEVSDGVFADRRRKAAEWLLRGYRELLAQELPDEKPELPVVEKIGGFDGKGGAEEAQARARHAAQMAARQQAVFVQDQVFRRDVLVLQLRGLYKPNPNQANRDDKGPDELQALAAKTLPDDAAVTALMERVMK